jgi:hypothetical protein
MSCGAEESSVVTFREVLLELLDLPGATYSCVADRATGVLLDEVGASSVAPTAVVELGGSAAGFLSFVAGDGLDDLMLTSHRSYHLVRPVVADSRPPLMIYLCLDRGRSNLAAARRELAAPSLHKRLAAATAGPRPRPAELVGQGAPRAVPAALPAPRNTSSPAVSPLAMAPQSRSVHARAAPPQAADSPSSADHAAAEHPAETTATRLSAASVPLPRRAGPKRVPAPLPAAAGESRSAAGQAWATDVGTMRRLLSALRALR